MLSHIRPSRGNRDKGFSLLEVMIATTVLTTGLLSLAQLFSLATTSNRASRDATLATVLAVQKLEELRALAWGFSAEGMPLSDTATDTSAQSEAPTGGTGLSPSPRAALRENTPGYVDFVDGLGHSLAGGDSAPPGAVYVRRWSVEPLLSDPAQTLVIQVVAARVREPGVVEPGPDAAGAPELVRVVGVRTRRAP